MHLPYRITGLSITPWLCELTDRPLAVPHHDMVILVDTGNIDADRYVWTPKYDMCA